MESAAPELSYPAYAVYGTNAEPTLIRRALDGLREVAFSDIGSAKQSPFTSLKECFIGARVKLKNKRTYDELRGRRTQAPRAGGSSSRAVEPPRSCARR